MKTVLFFNTGQHEQYCQESMLKNKNRGQTTNKSMRGNTEID